MTVFFFVVLIPCVLVVFLVFLADLFVWVSDRIDSKKVILPEGGRRRKKYEKLKGFSDLT